MKNLFYRLIIFIDTANENDLNYKIALYMANNFYRIASMRISELAKACYVSAATISRFCRDLGYENFAHLKHECASFKSNDRKFSNLINIEPELMQAMPQKATTMYINQIIHTLKQMPSYLNWNTIDRVLYMIHDAKDIAFFGTQFSNSIAVHFQTDLLMLEKFSVAYMDSERQMETAKTMNKESLAIIISVNGNYIKSSGAKTLKYLKRSGCKVVLITGLPPEEIDFPVDEIITFGTAKDGKSGKHALLTTVELMSLRYYTLFYPSSMQELKDYIL